MTRIHQISHELILPTDLEAAWEFIRSPKNLDKITPDDMPFEIVSDVPAEMYEGLLIEYRVGVPVLGRQTWLTELKHIREHHSFVDEQRIGPYKLWYHYHEITEAPGGVRFLDQVHYALPFGVLGSLAHITYVQRQLKHIFDYREQALREVFR
tara:strand:- start:4987 stop:5445 length:459 start_codon:yes stop_codon:yes gene_type:complete